MLYPHSELKMEKMCIIIIFLKYAFKYVLTLSAGPLGRAALWIKFKIILIFDSLNTTQLMAMITCTKKSSSKSTNIGPKVHIVTTWETIEKLKNNTPLGDSS